MRTNHCRGRNGVQWRGILRFLFRSYSLISGIAPLLLLLGAWLTCFFVFYRFQRHRSILGALLLAIVSSGGLYWVAVCVSNLLASAFGEALFGLIAALTWT